jgi:hypothetical protein
MTTIAGSGSLSHRHGSADPGPDPYQHVDQDTGSRFTVDTNIYSSFTVYGGVFFCFETEGLDLRNF